ncbi:MAG: nucleotidyltransferase domain-containing protein [Elusimicrobiota bacterium]
MAWLTKIEKKALVEFINKLTQEFCNYLKFVILYGSKARGDRHRESDVDLLIVMNKVDKKIWDKIVDLELETGDKYDYKSHLSIHPMTVKEYNWMQHRQLPFILNVNQEGIILWKYGKKTKSLTQIIT